MTFNWLSDFINFVTGNKVSLVTTAGVLSEIVIIIVNTLRQLRHNKKSMTTNTTKIIRIKSRSKPRLKDIIVWSINPLNLFNSIEK